MSEENPTLFNGKLISLQDWSAGEQLQLTLGKTCYRDQLFSNKMACLWRGNNHSAWLSRALGISAILQTADDKIVFMQRSRLVGEYPGLLDVLGGHIDMPAEKERITPELIFAAIKKEVCDEVGLNSAQVQIKNCLGLLQNSEIDKPELLFYATTGLNSGEINKCASVAKENFEYEHLLFITATPAAFNLFLTKKCDKFTPSAEGCLTIFKKQING